MKLHEKAHYLISSDESKEYFKNLMDDIISALLGDRAAFAKAMLTFAKTPFLIREQLFWAKLSAFINGVYLSDTDKNKLCAKITENGTKRDNPRRLLELIDRAETQQKVQYLINVTRSLLTDSIDLPNYFRICHAITHTLEEDLDFLKENIDKSDLPYNVCVQGLLTNGLMYQSVIDGNGDQKYSFTIIAEYVTRFALSDNHIDHYSKMSI